MAGERHTWEGGLVADTELQTISLFQEGWTTALWLAEEFEKAGINRQHVRITVEVLETSGGATKEAVQHES